jgi:hypothetical protein
MTTTLPGRRQCIRDFIDLMMEAHFDPGAARPTLGGLVDCLTDEEPAGLPRGEPLAVEPLPYRPHPIGNLRRGDGDDVWAHLPATDCYMHLPGEFAVRYKLEVCGGHTALALKVMPPLPEPELSENFVEFPLDRLIIDPVMIMILVPAGCLHDDVEIHVS